MKKLSLSIMAVCMFSTVGLAQNISGPPEVCENTIRGFGADESPGNTHKKWVGVLSSQLTGGTSLNDSEIQIDFGNVGGYSLLLGWDPVEFDGQGGELDIDIIHQSPTTMNEAGCSLGTGEITLSANEKSQATGYEFEVCGFGSGLQTKFTTSTSTVINVNNTSLPGSIRVKVYYHICDAGSNDGYSTPSSTINYGGGDTSCF